MKQLTKIGIIGAGNMDSGISQEGLSVVMIDTQEMFKVAPLSQDK